MGYLLLGIFCSAGAMLILRALTERGMGVSAVNFIYRLGMGGAAGVTLITSFSWQNWPDLWLATWHLILPGIALLYATGITSMHSLNRGHIGVTTMVTRASIVLPVSFVLTHMHRLNPAEFTRLLPFAAIGCLSILAGFLCFCIDRSSRRHSESPSIWILWLIAAFFTLGGWDILVASSAGLNSEESRFCFCVIPLGVAVLAGFQTKLRVTSCEWRLVPWAFGAGLLATLLLVIRPIAVRELGGLVVFPAFAIGVVVVMQVVGALAWKQRIGWQGVLGMAFSAIGIVFLVYCRN